MPDRTTVASSDQDAAAVSGFEDVRAWADGPLDAFALSLRSSRLVGRPGHQVNYLALSGGGAGGAFATGVLNGWTRAGGRPEFDLVTGVSTGALIAPFAFLGSDYDALLKALYLNDQMDGLAKLQNPLAVLGSGGLMDPRPLRLLVERYADARMLALIAEEHRKGRRLLVVTTNLDAQRPVVWNLGAIAASGRPDAVAIFRDILVASASVPGVFPPVLIDATNGANEFKEMHVDGSTTEEVFIAPELLPQTKGPRSKAADTHIWVIVNNTLTPEYAVTKVGAIAIASRALSTLAKSQTIWIVKAAQERALRSGVDFNVTFIDRDVPYDTSKPFKSDYMRKVYDLGYGGAVNHTLWQKTLAPFLHSAVAVNG